MIDEDPEELSYRYGKTTTMSNEYQVEFSLLFHKSD